MALCLRRGLPGTRKTLPPSRQARGAAPRGGPPRWVAFSRCGLPFSPRQFPHWVPAGGHSCAARLSFGLRCWNPGGSENQLEPEAPACPLPQTGML